MEKFLTFLTWTGVTIKFAVPTIYLGFFIYALASKERRKWLWYCFTIGMAAISLICAMFAIWPGWCLRHDFWHHIIAYGVTCVVALIVYAVVDGDVSEPPIKRKLIITSLLTVISAFAMRYAVLQRLSLADYDRKLAMYFNDGLVIFGVIQIVSYWTTMLVCRARAVDRLIISVASVVTLSILTSGIPAHTSIVIRGLAAVCIGLAAAAFSRWFVLKTGVGRETNFFHMSGEERMAIPIMIRLLIINGTLTLSLFLPIILSQVLLGITLFSTRGAFKLLPLLPAVAAVTYLWLVSLRSFRKVVSVAIVKDWHRPPLRSFVSIAAWMLTFPLPPKASDSGTFRGRLKKFIAKYWLIISLVLGVFAGYAADWLLWQKNMAFFARHQGWVDGLELSILLLCLLCTFLFGGALKKWGANIITIGRTLKAFLFSLSRNAKAVKQMNNAEQIRKVVERIPPDAGRIWISLAAGLAAKDREIFLKFIVAWLKEKENRPSPNDDEILSAILSERISGRGCRQSMVIALFESEGYGILRELQRRRQLDGQIMAEVLWNNPFLASRIIEYDADMAYKSLLDNGASLETIGRFLSSHVEEERLLVKLLSDSERFERLWLLLDFDKRDKLCQKLPIEVPSAAHASNASHDYFWRSPLSVQSALIAKLDGSAATFFEANSVSTARQIQVFSRLPEQAATAILEHINSYERLPHLFQSIHSEPEKLTRIMESLSPQRLAEILTRALGNTTGQPNSVPHNGEEI